MLSLLPSSISVPLVFAVLFHDLGKPATRERDATGRIRFSGHESVSARMTEKIMKRLRFSNEEVQATVEMVQNHMVFKDVQSMRVARLKRFMARPTFSDELELHRVDCLASHGLLDNHEFLKRRRDEFANEPLIPRPLLSGHDLIAIGWKPGPKFKTTLDAVQVRQLEGSLQNARRGPRLESGENFREKGEASWGTSSIPGTDGATTLPPPGRHPGVFHVAE